MNIPFAGIIQGEEEIEAVNRVLKSKWHAQGNEADALEKEIASYTGAKYAVVMSSGSMANFNALLALDLPEGSEVITSGVGFPATLTPIIRAGLKPVLVDYDLETHNIDLEQIEKAITEKTKAIILAHTMGLPVDMKKVLEIAKKHNLKVIEDCCEALGSKIGNKHVGTFGDIGTFSFYPSHQINGLGGGGAVITNNKDIAIRLRSLRDWGKYQDSTDFKGDHKTEYNLNVDGILYDEQYTYQTMGLNSRMTDVMAAYTRVQFKRLDEFVTKRVHNWYSICYALYHTYMFYMPKLVHNANPAFFGFTLILKDGDRDEFSRYLESNGIRTRPFFAGNITRQEPFKKFKKDLPVGDYLMRNALFVGVWPGIEQKQLEYMIDKIKEYFE